MLAQTESAFLELKRVLSEELGLNSDASRIAASRLRRTGLRLQRLAVHACNRELSKHEEKEDAELWEHFKILCSDLGCGWHLSGDPRGYVCHIVFSSGRNNTMGGAECGWGVTG